jgi:regulator of sirC expression with transglutaminase-like and TPR domain
LVDEFDVPAGLYLQAAPPREILARLLRNLKEIYRAQEDWPRLLAVQQRLVTLVPDHLPEWRDRGLAHAELGQIDQAVSDLEHYVSQTDDALDRDAIEHRIEELRRERG